MMKYFISNIVKRSFVAVCVVMAIAQPAGAQSPSWFLDFNENNIFPYRPVPLAGPCNTRGTQELLGHKLPAEQGGTGIEDPLSEDGHVIFNDGSLGAKVAFSNLIPQSDPTLSQLYRDYYITMRWNYVKWGWDGFETTTGDEDKEFYSQGNADGTPRKVLVTNPETNKSIVAVVLEAGPAPWTGVLIPPDSLLNGPSGETAEQRSARIAQLRAWLNERAPDYWKTPQAGTPEGYNGRVSGLPPTAIAALGATMRMADGSGHDLIYSWAPDQTAQPGPIGGSTSSDAASRASACSGRTLNIDGLTYAFPVEPQTKIDYSNLPCGSTSGCHAHETKYDPNSSAAFDLMYGPHGALDGKAVYAITDGTVYVRTVPYKMGSGEANPECRSLHLYSDAAYGDYHYWYGHLMNVVDEDTARQPGGRKVKAGDKIAEVAKYDFGSSCRGGRDHLHIDRGPLGLDGGGGHGRDLEFVEFLNKMWEMLPEN